MMDCRRVNALWDEYRDGTLDQADAEALELHLADCRSCETLWRRESQWIGILAEKAPADSTEDVTEFTQEVLNSWDRTRKSVPVLGRIRPIVSVAAAVAVLVIGGMLAQRAMDTTTVVPPRTEVATTTPAATDALQAMYNRVGQPAATVRNAIGRSNTLLDVDTYVNPIVSFLQPNADAQGKPLPPVSLLE